MDTSQHGLLLTIRVVTQVQVGPAGLPGAVHVPGLQVALGRSKGGVLESRRTQAPPASLRGVSAAHSPCGFLRSAHIPQGQAVRPLCALSSRHLLRLPVAAHRAGCREGCKFPSPTCSYRPGPPSVGAGPPLSDREGGILSFSSPFSQNNIRTDLQPEDGGRAAAALPVGACRPKTDGVSQTRPQDPSKGTC